jgi:asparagine synthase (glutamine-hydrolysing)
MVETMLDALAMHGGYRRFTCDSGIPNANILGQVALGGLLTHMVPEDPFDQQPLWNDDCSACLVADVRLDNRADLVRELNLQHPEELADSAILFAAWNCWGEACLHHILGGFAFAVWLPAQQTIFAARDHTGERGLFYHRGNGFVAIASMPKGLLAIPGIYQGFDSQRVVDNLVLTHPNWQSSYYQGISRLPLGHTLRITPAGVECRPYWHPCDAKPIRFQRDEDYVEALLEIFDQATAARLRSPRGIAAQLSAGMDSSSVVATAARLLEPEHRRLLAYTSVPREGFLGKGLPGRLIYEGPGAADVAALYPNVDHILIDSSGYDLVADLKAWTDAMDEPAQNCVNLLWMSAIMHDARTRGAGVMLHGLSGNATISADGWEAMTSYFRTGRWLQLFRFANNLRNRGELSFKASFVLATNGLLPRWLKKQIKPGARTLQLDFSPVNPAIVQQYDLEEKAFQKLHGNLPDLRTQRARFFERFDPAPLNAAIAARYGLENRDPMGDKRIFEFCFNIPIEQYAAQSQSRSLVRRSMRDRLPASTLARNVRGQQGADWYLTVAEALPAMQREVASIGQSPVAQRFLDIPRLERLIQTWPATGHETGQITNSWNYALTRGISLGYLLRKSDTMAEPKPSF